MSQLLKEWLNENWQVKISTANSDNKTLAEQYEEDKKNLKIKLENSELMKKIKESFPKSTIENIN